MKKKYMLIALALVLLIACTAAVLVAGSGRLEDKTGWQRTVYAIVNRDEIINTKFEGAVSEYAWTPELEYRLEDHAVVQKTPGEDFVIMNVTDLHMADFSQCAVTNIRNLQNIRAMAESLQPDLITLSGDIFWTNMREGSCAYSAYRLTEFMDSLGIPWAPVFGNHDGEGNCDLNYLADIMMQGKFCLMQKGDPEMGVGNYVVNICQGEEVVHSLILFDSHNGNLWDNQVDWYRWAAESISETAGKAVPSTVLMHVPFAQYVYGYDAAWDEASGGWKSGTGAFGVKGEAVCCETQEDGTPLDNGFFDVIREVGTTKNALCGHDHANTFSVVWEDVRLTYSLRLGYGAYFENYNQGVTTLTICDNGETVVEHHYLYPYDVENP